MEQIKIGVLKACKKAYVFKVVEVAKVEKYIDAKNNEQLVKVLAWDKNGRPYEYALKYLGGKESVGTNWEALDGRESNSYSNYGYLRAMDSPYSDIKRGDW